MSLPVEDLQVGVKVRVVTHFVECNSDKVGKEGVIIKIDKDDGWCTLKFADNTCSIYDPRALGYTAWESGDRVSILSGPHADKKGVVTGRCRPVTVLLDGCNEATASFEDEELILSYAPLPRKRLRYGEDVVYAGKDGVVLGEEADGNVRIRIKVPRNELTEKEAENESSLLCRRVSAANAAVSSTDTSAADENP